MEAFDFTQSMACRPQTKKLTVASNCIHLSEAPKKVDNKNQYSMHNQNHQLQYQSDLALVGWGCLGATWPLSQRGTACSSLAARS